MEDSERGFIGFTGFIGVDIYDAMTFSTLEITAWHVANTPLLLPDYDAEGRIIQPTPTPVPCPRNKILGVGTEEDGGRGGMMNKPSKV